MISLQWWDMLKRTGYRFAPVSDSNLMFFSCSRPVYRKATSRKLLGFSSLSG
jgi:hypothetical protein